MSWTYRLLMVSLLAATACEKKVDAGKVPTAETLQAFRGLCEEAIRIECEANQNCCQSPRHTYESVDACVKEEVPKCAWVMSSPELTSGRISINQSAFAAAREEMKAAAAACRDVDDKLADLLLVPTLDSNANCGGTIEEGALHGCKAGLFCKVTKADFSSGYDNARYEATCRPRGKLGGACEKSVDGARSNDECEDGAWCEPNASGADSGTCRAQPGLGEDCEWNVGCRGDLQCSDDKKCVETFVSDESRYCFDRWGTFCERRRTSSGGTSADPASRTCKVEFACPGETSYGFSCQGHQDGSYLCTCVANKVLGKQFQSLGLCDAGEEEQAQALRDACGFEMNTGVTK